MRRLVVLPLLLIGIAIAGFNSAPTAALTQGTNLSTSPISRDLQVTPGHSVTTTLDVENNDTTPLLINLGLETFRPYGDKGQAQILPFAAHTASANWVHFSRGSFTAPPGVWVPIKMTISTPPTAALDYYYAVVVKPKFALATEGKNVETLKGYNAILVLLNASSPNARPRLSIASFSASHSIYEYLPASFSIKVNNPGNVFLPPSGDIYISRTSNFSSTIDTIPINPTQGEVIPGSARSFSSQWTDGFPLFSPKTVDGQPITDKNGNPIEVLQWNFSHTAKFRFGKYYAKMVLVYNNGTRDIPTTAILSFWVIPWKLILGIAVVVILSVIGLYVSGEKVADRTARLSRKVRRR